MSIHKSTLILKSFALEIVLLVLILFLSIFAPGFFSLVNFFNILRNVSTQGIIAFAMTMVIISGEIDLSVGSAVAFGGCLCAVLVQILRPMIGDVYSVIIAMIVTLSFGVAQGFFTGMLRQKYNIPSFIITLALLTALFGMANLVTKGFPIAPYPSWFGFLGSGRILGVPFPAILFIILLLVFHFTLNNTVFGRAIYAVGGNIKSAQISGIDVWNIKTKAFIITSTIAAFSGILVSSQILSGNSGYSKRLGTRCDSFCYHWGYKFVWWRWQNLGDVYRSTFSWSCFQRNDIIKHKRILAVRCTRNNYSGSRFDK